MEAIAVIGAWVAAGGTTAIAGVVAGTATVGTYIAVAGAVLTTVGAVLGKEDLMKVGGLMTLGGGLANSAAGSAAGAGAEAGAGEAASEIGTGALAENAMNASAQNPNALGQGIAGDFSSGPMLDSSAYGIGQNAATAASPLGLSASASQPLNAATSTQGTKGALDWLNKIGSHVKENKELYQIGGSMLEGAFGPEAEALDLQREILERRRKNANTIVPLGKLGMLGKNLGRG